MENRPSVPTAEFRRICWKARDDFNTCCEKYKTEEDQTKNCTDLRKAFESSCPKSWVKHFVRRRAWDEYKKEVYSNKNKQQQNQQAQ